MSLRELDDPQNAKKKNDFLKAWRELKKKSPDDGDSFWSIASYHGMPFKARQVDPKVIPPNKDSNSAWNGYCQHGNILFPTWHRFYCLKLEQALQKAFPEGDVALHYWDQTSPDNLKEGFPPLLLEKEVMIDGVTEDNPLLSFSLPKDIDMENGEEDENTKYYAKPKGYTTVRYPWSGIANPQASREVAEKHNASINEDPITLLKENARYWLNVGRAGSTWTNTSILEQFKSCLGVSSYNMFSNTTSRGGSGLSSVEDPHNSIHLCVGGFTTPKYLADGEVQVPLTYFGLIEGANGDMGENETAAFDPIFFLHHCNIDRMLWLWQNKYGHLTDIPLDANSEGDPGRHPISQGPSPYQKPNETLDWETKLHPYQDKDGNIFNSTQCFDISKLGYAYSIGSLDDRQLPNSSYSLHSQKHAYIQADAESFAELLEKFKDETIKYPFPVHATFDISHLSLQIPPALMPMQGQPVELGFVALCQPQVCTEGNVKFETTFSLNVKNLQKSMAPGSFVVQAFYRQNNKLYFLGQRAVLDRWDRTNCQNCQMRPTTSVGFAITQVLSYCTDIRNIEVHVVSKDPATGKRVVQVLKQDGPPCDTTYCKGVAGKPSFHIMAHLQQQLWVSD